MWRKVGEELPELDQVNLCDEPCSREVLVFTKFGSKKVAVLEQWSEDRPARWHTTCSEHWDIDEDVTNWTELPEDPSEV